MKRLPQLRSKLRSKLLTFQHPGVASAMRWVMDEHLTYLEVGALGEIAESVIQTEKKGIKGSIIEAGCALGGSAIVMAHAKHKERAMFVYDVFGMIPPPSDRDGQDIQERYQVIKSGRSAGIAGERYYGYEPNLYDKVRESFVQSGVEPQAHRVNLIKGLYEESLRVDSPVALAHIDCDWYASVLTCLERIEPFLVPGGTLIIDDYYSWSGCRTAVDDYFGRRGKGRYRFVNKHRLHIIKR